MIDFINISNPVLDYLLRVIICSGILWLICLMTARYINFRAARALIIGSAIISIIMPLWRIGVFPAAEQFLASSPIITENLEPISITNVVGIAGQSWFTLERILMLTYGGVMLILIARMTAGLIGITRYRQNSITTCHKNIEVKINPVIETPFSFGHTIYIGDMESCAEREMILLHESVHVRERHSVEVLAMEILTVIMWINPFFHLLKKLLREVHEYQADSAVVAAGNDVEKYKLLIFSQLTGQIPELAGALTNSLTKKRLIMITQKIRSNSLRALLLLPALVLCAALVSFTTVEVTTDITQPPAEAPVYKGHFTPAPENENKKTIILITRTGISAITGDRTTNDNVVVKIDNGAAEKINPKFTINGIVVTMNELSLLPHNQIRKMEVTKNTVAITTTIPVVTAAVASVGNKKQAHAVPIPENNNVTTITVTKNGATTNSVQTAGKAITFKYADDVDYKNMPTITVNGAVVTDHNIISRIEAKLIQSIKVQNNTIAIIANLPKVNGRYLIVSEIQKGSKDDAPLLFAQEMPKFKGESGQIAFSKWIMENLKYPKIALDNKASGRIVVSLVIDKEGKLKDLEVIITQLTMPERDSTHEDKTLKLVQDITKSVTQTILSAPDEWTAATNEGKPINLKINMPIAFKLD